MWRIEFQSDRFLPFLPEDAQANPGVYGFELATWLAKSLAGLGLATSYPLGEDWGWLLEYFEDELEVIIGCSSVCAEADGYRGSDITWSIFLDPRRSLKQKLTGVSAEAVVSKLQEGIHAALESAGIAYEVV